MKKLDKYFLTLALILLNLIVYGIVAIISAAPLIAFFVGMNWVDPRTFLQKLIFFVIFIPILWIQIMMLDHLYGEKLEKFTERLKKANECKGGAK